MSDSGFFATKERTTAWIFRALITVAGFTGTAVLSLLLYSWTDFKDAVKDQNKATWAAVATASKAISDTSSAVSVMQREMQDYIGQETQIDTELKEAQKDHEQRIRAIEHAVPGIDGR
jgi:predicted secreted hydrolase